MITAPTQTHNKLQIISQQDLAPTNTVRCRLCTLTQISITHTSTAHTQLPFPRSQLFILPSASQKCFCVGRGVSKTKLHCEILRNEWIHEVCFIQIIDPALLYGPFNLVLRCTLLISVHIVVSSFHWNYFLQRK